MAMESPESRAPGAAPPDRRVLFLAYEYPPLGGVGIVRTTQFAKYLPRCGWQPSVLTVQNPDRFYTTEGGDRGPRGVTVHRAFNPLNNLSVVEGGLRRLRLDRKVFVPDVYGGWAWSAARVGTDLVRREEISVVYATCPPYSTALAGARIAATTGVPLVVDLRDAWTLSPYAPSYLFPWQRRREERLESVVLETAAHVVTATDAIREDYERTYPEIRDRISTVLNGFDPELLPAHVQPFPRFTIAYTGFFYGAQSPESFLDALSVVLHEHRVPPGDLRFVWAGRDAPFVRQLARDRGLEEVVEYLGLLPKPEADALLARSHLLFFLLGENDRVSQRRVLTSKLFPYLASGRPILALVPEGDAMEMIRTYSPSSFLVSPGDVDGIAGAIVEAYGRYRHAGTSRVSDQTARFRREYSVEARTRELAAIFDGITSPKTDHS
jgi:glycosyltransferase involved in cell wall biosynthesis